MAPQVTCWIRHRHTECNAQFDSCREGAVLYYTTNVLVESIYRLYQQFHTFQYITKLKLTANTLSYHVKFTKLVIHVPSSLVGNVALLTAGDADCGSEPAARLKLFVKPVNFNTQSLL